MPSKHDAILAAHIAAGRSVGSLADRAMLLLASKGATTGSLADRQRQLGKRIKDTIDPVDYP